MNREVIVGVDPGLAHLGVSFVEHTVSTGALRVITAYQLISKRSDGSLGQRLESIQKTLEKDIATLRGKKEYSKCVWKSGIEDSRITSLTFAATLTKVFQSVAVCLVVFNRAAIPTALISPSSVKQHVAGHGRAGKLEMRKAVNAHLKVEMFTKASEEHAVDATGVAISCANPHIFEKFLDR